MVIARPFWTALGLLFVASGIAGVFLPGWPTTINLILALACFKKGSARLEAWLLNHPMFGAQLRDWEENRWITARAKWIAGSSIVFFGIGSLFFIPSPWVQTLGALLTAYGLFFVLDCRTKPSPPRPLAQPDGSAVTRPAP